VKSEEHELHIRLCIIEFAKQNKVLIDEVGTK
jgi:hypothetical protein